MRRGLVLFGHGSRDPRWREPIEAVARRATALSGDVAVRCAYLELAAPDLPTAAAELVAQGVTDLEVVPMFLGMGKHAREDLPALIDALRAAHPAVRITAQDAVGEHPAVIDLLAHLALQKMHMPGNS